MSTTVTLYANKSARVDIDHPNTNYSNETLAAARQNTPMYIGFEQPTGLNLYKNVEDVYVHVCGQAVSSTGEEGKAFVQALASGFDEQTVTWNTRPSLGRALDDDWIDFDSSRRGWASCWLITRSYAAIQHGVMAYSRPATSAQIDVDIYTSRSSYKPYAVVTFYDSFPILFISGKTPRIGFINKREALTFTWKVEALNSSCIGEFKAVSAKISWKSSESGAVTTVNCDSPTSHTFPPNYFTTGTVMWQVEVTDPIGATYTSGWDSLTTEDSTSMATPIAPVNQIVSNNEDNVFHWQHKSPTGSTQTAADLQISSDGSTWTALGHISGAEQSLTVSAGSFSVGRHYWRVRTYNADSVAGAWSQAAVFNAIGYPDTPSILIEDNGARPVIAWQSSEQAAWELSFDGELYRGFGSDTADMRWRAPDYVSNGTHTVKVRVQNSLGMYSPWAEASVTVQVSAGSITLNAQGGEIAELAWSGTGYDFFIVYRDDVPIARTTGSEYRDLFSAGSVIYKVRGGYEANSSYGISEAVEVLVRPTSELLIDAETGETVDLSLTDEQYRSIQISDSLSYGTYQLSGRVKPSVEVGKYRSKTIAFTSAFETPEEEAALLGLLGRVVCCKTRRGRMAIGVLTGIPIEDQEFYSVFTISVTDSDFPEVIDIDSGRPL